METLVRRWAVDTGSEAPREDDDVRADLARSRERVEAVEAVVQAFVPEPGRAERLESEAKAIAERWPDPAARPPLYGLPVGIKDVIHVDGLPTRGGSALPPEALAGPQAEVVTRLREAGALIAGKTVTAEFAVLAPGPTRNPHNPAHTPGGSSSGSAAAVAAGMIPLAVGTQTVGSMIRPGAFCGVTAFKPTYDRIPASGVIPNAKSFDTVGVYAADLAGIRLLAPIVCDDWRDTVYTGRRPVLGVPDGPYLDFADDTASRAFASHVELLRAAGFDVRRVPALDDFADVRSTQFTINRFELAETHRERFAEHGRLYRPETVTAIREGERISRPEYVDALAARAAFRARFTGQTMVAGVDVWIAPPAPGVAPEGIGTTGSSIMCLPWSFAGLPALSLPTRRPPGALPIGLQCVGAFGMDEQLLADASLIEQALNGVHTA